MTSLWFEIPVQLIAMAALAAVVYRDAVRRRNRLGAAPGGISPQTWAGVCGLLWVPAVFYVVQRRRQDEGQVQAGASVKHGWWLIGLGIAVAWLVGDIQAGRTSSVVEHALYLGLVLAGWGWATATATAEADHSGHDTTPRVA